MSGTFIFKPALEDYWSQHPSTDTPPPATSQNSPQPTPAAEASIPAPAAPIKS